MAGIESFNGVYDKRKFHRTVNLLGNGCYPLFPTRVAIGEWIWAREERHRILSIPRSKFRASEFRIPNSILYDRAGLDVK